MIKLIVLNLLLANLILPIFGKSLKDFNECY